MIWLAILGWTLALAVGLAVVETLFAKMRLLRVPLVLGTGSLLAVLGSVSWFTTMPR